MKPLKRPQPLQLLQASPVEPQMFGHLPDADFALAEATLSDLCGEAPADEFLDARFSGSSPRAVRHPFPEPAQDWTQEPWS